MMLMASITAHATTFNLNVATVDTAYAHYVTALAVVDSDQAHIAALGTAPTPPTNAVSNNDWNGYVTSLNTYNSSLITYQDSLVIHQGTLRTNELAVLTALGYNTGYTNICVNQWVKVQGSSFTTAWIGFSSLATYLTVVFVQPTKPYPNY